MADSTTHIAHPEDDAPAVPPDALPESDPVDEDEFDPDAEEAALRAVGDGAIAPPTIFEAPGRETTRFEDERALDERTKLDEFIARAKQTPGATGKVFIERLEPRDPPECCGYLDEVEVSLLEDQNVQKWLKDNFGGGLFRLAIRDGMSRYRAHIQIRVSGSPKVAGAAAGTGEYALVKLVETMVEKIDKRTGGSGADSAVEMMRIQMERDAQRHEQDEARRERDAKERLEQMRLESRERMEFMLKALEGNRPAQDPLELALKLSENSTRGLQKTLEFSHKAMSETMMTAIRQGGDMSSHMMKHFLGTLRDLHKDEQSQDMIDRMMSLAGSLAGPAQKALETVVRGTQGGAAPAPAPAAPAKAPAGPPPPPPPGPGGRLPGPTPAPALAPPEPPGTGPELDGAEPEPGGPSSVEDVLAERAAGGLQMRLELIGRFCRALSMQLMADPDPQTAWSVMDEYYGMMPGDVRERIETLSENLPEDDSIESLLPFGQALLGIFEDLCGQALEGEPRVFTELRNEVEAIKRCVLEDPRRAIWLREFLAAGPWFEDDDSGDGDD